MRRRCFLFRMHEMQRPCLKIARAHVFFSTAKAVISMARIAQEKDNEDRKVLVDVFEASSALTDMSTWRRPALRDERAASRRSRC